MTDDIQNDLKDLDNDFMATPPAERNRTNNVPDGNYQAKLDVLRFDKLKSEKSNELVLRWEFIIVLGDYQGQKLQMTSFTRSIENIRWIKTDLLTCGLDTAGIPSSELPDHFPALLDRIIEVSVKRKFGNDGKEHFNIFLNRLVLDSNGVPDIDDPFAENAPPQTRGAGADPRDDRTPPATRTPPVQRSPAAGQRL